VVGKTEGKTPFENRRRCDGKIKMDLQEME
jgi:hypothetical protein